LHSLNHTNKGSYLLSPVFCLLDSSDFPSGSGLSAHSLFRPFLLTLKIIFRVPTREHLVEQLSLPVVTQTAPVVAVTEVSVAAD
jgi:hypothetical protein